MTYVQVLYFRQFLPKSVTDESEKLMGKIGDPDWHFESDIYRNVEFKKSKSGEPFPKWYTGFREWRNNVAPNRKKISKYLLLSYFYLKTRVLFSELRNPLYLIQNA